MPNELSITLKTDCVKAEADGSTCELCGDNCYLDMYTVRVWFVEIPEEPIQIVTTLCGSCGQALLGE